jgi:hypothetical protein
MEKEGYKYKEFADTARSELRADKWYMKRWR